MEDDRYVEDFMAEANIILRAFSTEGTAIKSVYPKREYCIGIALRHFDDIHIVDKVADVYTFWLVYKSVCFHMYFFENELNEIIERRKTNE